MNWIYGCWLQWPENGSSLSVAISGGYAAVGVGGGLDFLDAYWSTNSVSWRDDTFNNFASNDNGTRSWAIESKIWLNKSRTNVRTVLSWLTRGDYTFANRDDWSALGLDLDMSIYDPNGQWVASSSHRHNSYEIIEFDPEVTGQYTIVNQRTSMRDSALDFSAGLTTNYSINYPNGPACTDSDGDGYGWNGFNSCAP